MKTNPEAPSMENSFNKILQGYQTFRKRYAIGDQSVMQHLSDNGQKPEIMVVACCDSRVDPALILQCDPGDLFVTRNVANIIPPYEIDEAHHGTSAALEFGICFLNVKHLILFGHSQCGGIHERLNENVLKNDFITHWVSLIKPSESIVKDTDEMAKQALIQSKKNCHSFPWITQKVDQKLLKIHLWFLDIKTGIIFTYSETKHQYIPLIS